MVQLSKEPSTSVKDDEDKVNSMIVCFLADGSPKYTEMTCYALNSFLENTPRVRAGLLTIEEKTKDEVLTSIPFCHHSRIVHKITSKPHFEEWNPTQYKLDISLFANEYETVFWMDSDTACDGDVTNFLLQFAKSESSFFLVPDHVMYDETFCDVWKKTLGDLFMVPQACVMGFKSSVISTFFELWKSTWQQWISPKPFAKYPDPNPRFAGSAFCIEQYALGMSISKYLKDHELNNEVVLTFAREGVHVPVKTHGSGSTTGKDAPSQGASEGGDGEANRTTGGETGGENAAFTSGESEGTTGNFPGNQSSGGSSGKEGKEESWSPYSPYPRRSNAPSPLSLDTKEVKSSVTSQWKVSGPSKEGIFIDRFTVEGGKEGTKGGIYHFYNHTYLMARYWLEERKKLDK